jgi:hypothetical protein
MCQFGGTRASRKKKRVHHCVTCPAVRWENKRIINYTGAAQSGRDQGKANDPIAAPLIAGLVARLLTKKTGPTSVTDLWDELLQYTATKNGLRYVCLGGEETMK